MTVGRTADYNVPVGEDFRGVPQDANISQEEQRLQLRSDSHFLPPTGLATYPSIGDPNADSPFTMEKHHCTRLPLLG